MVSWGWRSDTPNPSHFVDEHEWAGTRDIAAYLTTPAAIDFMVEHDWDTVRADCHALAAEARRQLLVLTALPPLHDEAAFAQMFPHHYPIAISQPSKRGCLMSAVLKRPLSDGMTVR